MLLQPVVQVALYALAVLVPLSVDVVDAEELYMTLSATGTLEPIGSIAVEHLKTELSPVFPLLRSHLFPMLLSILPATGYHLFLMLLVMPLATGCCLVSMLLIIPSLVGTHLFLMLLVIPLAAGALARATLPFVGAREVFRGVWIDLLALGTLPCHGAPLAVCVYRSHMRLSRGTR
ncbi:hypothetical protein LCGC14_1356150 [marine sediment metagenome]|uniref:Uncharacterized protein n=1 Tax=marine sediment metagenome TaxID=412755 RepID=A0A0F9MPZ3_9ZZZZ